MRVAVSRSCEANFIDTKTEFVIVPVAFVAAYKHADGKKIDGKRVLVDVERARTVKGWLPRRLGKFNYCLPFRRI